MCVCVCVCVCECVCVCLCVCVFQKYLVLCRLFFLCDYYAGGILTLIDLCHIMHSTENNCVPESEPAT